MANSITGNGHFRVWHEPASVTFLVIESLLTKGLRASEKGCPMTFEVIG